MAARHDLVWNDRSIEVARARQHTQTIVNSLAGLEQPSTTAGSSSESSPPEPDSARSLSKSRNYSSRNLLRQSHPIPTGQQRRTFVGYPNAMSLSSETTYLDRLAICIIPGPVGDYETLNSDSFLAKDDKFLYCMLCARKERSQAALDVEHHLASEVHNENYCNLRTALLNLTPQQGSLQMAAIHSLLATWLSNQTLTKPMVIQRCNVIHEFVALVQAVDPQCTCRVIGSLKYGAALTSSDINLELLHPNSALFEKDPKAKNSIHHQLVDPSAEYGHQINNHTLHYDLVPNALDTLHSIMLKVSAKYQSFQPFQILSNLSDLNNRVPKLLLQHIPTGLHLEVSCYAESRSKLADLLEAYLSLDSRACDLSKLVKHWAGLCKIDNPSKGTLPPEAFVILVIFFLQRTSPPVLPCLHQRLSDSSKQNCERSQPPTESLSKLNLESETVITDVQQQVGSTGQNGGSNGTESGPIGPDAGEDDAECEEEEDDDRASLDINWFMEFMMKEFNSLANVISIRTLDRVSLGGKQWGTQLKAIEHPIRPSLNISRCIGTRRIFEYIKMCFKYGFYYLTSLPLDIYLKPKTEFQPDPRDYIELYVNRERLRSYFSMKKDSMVPKSMPVPYKTTEEMMKQALFERDVEVMHSLLERNGASIDSIKQLPSIIARSYQVNLMIPRDAASTEYCWLCKKVGHSRTTCPQAELQNLQYELENYEYELDSAANLDRHLERLHMDDIIKPTLAKRHSQVIIELTHIINSATGLNCDLQLFGSTVNSLGSSESDLDICMTLKGNPTGKDVPCVDILQKVYDVLRNLRSISQIEAILTARVPILKMRYYVFDIDLSMYNQCAIFNSELLKAYSQIDRRVSPLIYLVKRYAKSCGIADASKGCLSSYAWGLMVIHYLQNTSPPILPVLQEPSSDTRKEMIGVNGWNVWFEREFDGTQMPKNMLGLTQLLKGFFLYFGTFDFNYRVVSIRKHRLITRFEKNWNNCMIAIEDPFELTYNLSSRLDDAMAIYIINSFSQAFRHIVKLQLAFTNKSTSWSTLLKLAEQMLNGREICPKSPPYRGCKFCAKIGHRVKDCPERLQRSRKIR